MGTKTTLSRAERVEDALWLLDNGETPWHVARRLGIGLAYLDDLLLSQNQRRDDVLRALRLDEADKKRASRRH